MLLNSKVIRRKDFTVQTLKAGSGMGVDPNSPTNKQKNVSFGSNSGSASIKRNLMGNKSALGYSDRSPILQFALPP